MALKAEGIFPCIVLGANFGDDDRGSPQVQINVRIDDGPNKGQSCTYEEQVNTKSALYLGRSCTAVGWQGRDLRTLKDDVSKWIEKTGGKTTVEIRHLEMKRGKQYDRWVTDGQQGPAPVWDKVNSIGRGPRVLKEPSSDNLNDANEAMRAAMAADTGEDVNHASDDRIPF